MKNIVRLFVTLAVSALIANSFGQAAGPKGGGPGGPGGPGAAGQGRGRGMGMGMMRAGQEILDKLNLTAAQKKKVEALQKKTREQMEALRPKDGSRPKDTDREAMREKMRKIMEDHRAAMDKILTAEQKAKFEKLMKERMEQFRKERGGAGAPGGPGGAAGGAKGKGGKGGGGGGL